jgi:predicted dehydrogenase
MVHLPCLKSHPNADVAAICGRNRSRAEEVAKKFEVPVVFTDYREMIDKGDLHAIVVAAPDDLHHRMTMDGLDAGLHILCEKPIARNAEQAQEMYEKAESVGVKHMVMFTHRWWPHIEYLKKLIDEGFIGQCHHCDISLLWDYGRVARYEWRFDGKRSNGVLGDLGSHMIDWAQMFVGDIARVSAHLNNFVEHPGLDDQMIDPANDSALLALEFENGTHGVVHASYVPYLGNRMFEMKITLHGLSGTLEAILSAICAEVHAVQDDGKTFEIKTFPELLTGNIDQGDISPMFDIFCTLPVGDRYFIDSIIKDLPAAPNFYDGFKVQKVVDAAIQSHEKGVWVSL